MKRVFISLGYARGCKILCPYDKLMADFTRFAGDALREASVLEERNTILRTTRDLLLPKLISGEINVSELDIAVQEATA